MRWCRPDRVGADAAAQPTRFGFIYVPHGVILDSWTPRTDGANFEFTPILQAARAVQGAADRGQQPGRPAPDGGPGHAGAAAAWLTGDRAKRTEGRGRPARHDRRSVAGKAVRPGHAVPVARAGDRGFRRPDRRVRLRLQLHLHQHALAGRRRHAAADGDQSARRVRADVRRRQNRRSSAWRACARIAASSIRSRRSEPSLARGLGAARSRAG